LEAGFLSFPTAELKYFWTRITCTVCEDVGAGDPELMDFVLACSQAFTSSVGSETLHKVWSFLTAEMCKAQKSRLFCQLSCIEDRWLRDRVVLDAGTTTPWEDEVIVTEWELLDKDHEVWKQPHAAFSLKNNWRGQNMLKFRSYPIALNPVPRPGVVPPHETICDLPSFAHDQHTRTGKQAITRMSATACIGEFFRSHPTRSKVEPIGWAMFLQEGALIQNGLEDERLSRLENKFLAKGYGWSLEVWMEFQQIIKKAMFEEALVNTIRKCVVLPMGYCEWASNL